MSRIRFNKWSLIIYPLCACIASPSYADVWKAVCSDLEGQQIQWHDGKITSDEDKVSRSFLVLIFKYDTEEDHANLVFDDMKNIQFTTELTPIHMNAKEDSMTFIGLAEPLIPIMVTVYPRQGVISYYQQSISSSKERNSWIKGKLLFAECSFTQE